MDPRFITPLNDPSSSRRDPCLSKIYGEDLIAYLAVLQERNSRAWQLRYIPETLPSLVLSAGVVRLIFGLCESFCLSPEVKYIAIELFDRFVTRHFSELKKHIQSSSQNLMSMRKTWKLTVKRVQKQMLLRILTCIQIASKMDRQLKPVTMNMVQNCLTKAGLPYQKKSILQSELRIFRTLEFQIPFWSHLTFIETMLEGLQSWTSVDALLPICQKVLDVTLYRREEIYMRFFWVGTNRWERSCNERIECAAVELDNFLLATAIVLAALYIHPISGLGMKKTSRILWELTNVSQNDMEALAIVITEAILRPQRHERKS